MKTIYNVNFSDFSWLKNVKTGGVKCLFYPENIEELKDICLKIWKENKPLYVFGHTSNCYFLPSFSPDCVVSTLKLKDYKEFDDYVLCQPGAHIKNISRQMVEQGIVGYSGLVDLPGTVGAAVFGNAGCYGCEIADVFLEADVLQSNGDIVTYNKEQMMFARRTSALKQQKIEGVILTVKLCKRKGDLKKEKHLANEAHRLRVETQPGPSKNLGSCFMSGTRTFYFKVITKLVNIYIKVLNKNYKESLRITLNLLGYKHLIPYLFDWNRFIWIDENAAFAFNDYVKLYKRLHKGAKLEIRVYE